MSALATKIDLAEILESFELSDEEKFQDSLERLDALLISGEQVDCPLEDEFLDGIYRRERAVPSGTMFTTYTWKHQHAFECTMGELLVFDVNTRAWTHFQAPSKGVTQAGTKRIVYAITDVVWCTYHANPFNYQTREEVEHYLLENYTNRYLPLNKLKELQK